MDSNLKNMLKSLCCNNGWSYAVFWRFHNPGSMLLTMEDAYYEERMGILIDSMLLQLHLLGEGPIGQIALNGKHRWMFADSHGDEENSLGYDENRFILQQDDSEIRRQFCSGLKTILVISVEPQGVVQFGSTQKIDERLEILDQIRQSFKQLEYADMHVVSESAPSPLNIKSYDSSGLSVSLISSESVNYANPLEQLFSQSYPSTTTRSIKDSSVTSLQQQFTVQKFQESSIYSSLWDSSRLLESSDPFYRSDGDLLNSSSSMLTSQEELNPTELPPSYHLDDISQWFDPLPDQRINAGTFNAKNTHGNDETQKVLLTSNAKYDMFDGLRGETGEICENFAIPVVNNGLSEVTQFGIKSVIAPRKGLFSELGLEHILDEIVGDSDHANKRRKMGSLSAQPLNTLDNTTIHEQKKQFFPKSQVGLWINDSYCINGGSAVLSQPKRAVEPAKTTKKRARPGESTRARPKDRQQIQDRLCELRKLIPNTVKLSIDSLLDRTIKHMVFLQSLAMYADKLKQIEEPKLVGHKNVPVLKDNANVHGGGATWAFEVGGQSMVCPVIVEDLCPPGQMLIEMQCEERGMFLEIADIVRSFGLNILKGVIEVRENKIWARFIVEGKKHVMRKDIFWSLIELVQAGDNNTINQPSIIAHDQNGPLFSDYQQLPVMHPISVVDVLR